MKLCASALFALAFLPAIYASPTPHDDHGPKPKPKPKPVKPYPGLNELAHKAGLRYFGSATETLGPPQSDPAYQKVLNNVSEIGQLTPTNYQKWFAIEPEQGVFDFSQGDIVPNIAAENGQYERCHVLVWHSQQPDWLANGNWTRKSLLAVMENHIKKTIQHFGTRCNAWDVVNEALNEDGTYRESNFYTAIGEEYIPLAFQFANKYAPRSTKLYYNDYNIESPGAKSTAAQKIVKMVQKYRGTRIDGAGFQSHFTVGKTPSSGGDTPSYAQQKTNMDAFGRLGVEVALTELDVRMILPSTPEKLQQQKERYYNTVKACVDARACIGVTLWDFVDKYSWVPSTFPGEGAPCPWDDDVQRKPAYYGIQAALARK